MENEPVMDLLHEVPKLMQKWIDLGVDGFILNDVHKLVHVKDLRDSFKAWRTVMNSKSRRPHGRYNQTNLFKQRFVI